MRMMVVRPVLAPNDNDDGGGGNGNSHDKQSGYGSVDGAGGGPRHAHNVLW